jgi:hypothetical protein
MVSSRERDSSTTRWAMPCSRSPRAPAAAVTTRFPQISEAISPPRLSDQGEGGSGTRGVKDEFDGFGGDLLHVGDELAQAVVVGDPLRVMLGVLRR